MRWLWIAVVAAACGGAPAWIAEPSAAPIAGPPTFPRLPRAFAPTHVRAWLDLADGEWNLGRIEIAGVVAAPTSRIWLHAVALSIGGATATCGAAPAVRLRTSRARWPARDEPLELLALDADSPLPAGPCTLAIPFAPMTNSEPVGLFEARLGESRFLYTFMEPTYARRVFPMIDEPDVKVPWQLTLTVDAGDLAASNAPIVHEQVAGRFKDVEFAETAPLPSYLIAFAVGPFEVIDSATTASGVPIRVLAPPALVEGARPAAAVAADVDFFERWLGVPFPYPKLDVIVAPRGGPRWSAMENPGLVTIDSRMRGSAWATTMAHEVAHHWFGDLVTPAWWDDIWLNESFALWAGAKATGDARGFAATRLPAIPPATDAAHPEALDPEYFRGSRGAAVLAALERSIGPAAMQRAVHDYLTGHANGTVTTADFIAAVARASDRPAAGELTAELHTR